MSIVRFTFCILLLAAIWVAGCTTPKHNPDPLEGWKSYDGNHLDKAITDDCQDYIQKLPPKELEKGYVLGINFFEDGTGQHAGKIETGSNGKLWMHVLIYDKENKRIKVIKYADGRYTQW